MESCDIRNLDIREFITEHKEDVIILGYGGADTNTHKGYYSMGLLYRMHFRRVEGKADGTPNRCMLKGILECVKKINKPSNIYVLTTTALGFKKALKNEGPNRDLCNEVIRCAEDEKKSNLVIYSLHDKAADIRFLVRNATRYFKIVYCE